MATPNIPAAQGSDRNQELIRFVEDLVSGSAGEKNDAEIEKLLGLSSVVNQSTEDDDIDKIVKDRLGPLVKRKIEEKHEKVDMAKMTVVHLAAFEGPPELMKVLARRPKFLPDINAVNAEGRTPLHLASLTGKVETVEFLSGLPKLRGALEDKMGQTAFEIAVEVGWYEIESVLVQRQDVRDYLSERRANRTVSGDGTNAILVGAALIASITFAGWLQPPLGYQKYYHYPRNATMPGAPPDDFEQYATIGEHASLKVFWISNSLSFFFAIAAILAGAGAMVPRNSLHELAEVKRVHGALYLAGFAFSWAVVFVVVAFSAAGLAALPPVLKYEKYMIVTVVLGCIFCCLAFSIARISDPSFFLKYSLPIDPAFWVSQVSHLLECCCELRCGPLMCFTWCYGPLKRCFASEGDPPEYQSVESRLRQRKLYRIQPEKEAYKPTPNSPVTV